MKRNITLVIDSYSIKICSLEKKNEMFILKDCEDNPIWQSNKKALLSKRLNIKTQKYADYRKDSYHKDDPCIWVLKTISKTNASYRNIAVCKSKIGFTREINKHINQLVSDTYKSQKAETYRNLWNDDIDTIEFREINIDKYIKSIDFSECSSDDLFIKSLVSPVSSVEKGQVNKILRMLRAEFVEGKIACECRMRKGEGNGIWKPSGFGIDGEIYEYYI